MGKKEFYSVKEFAKAFGCSTDRIYEWLRKGYPKAAPRATQASAYHIPREELERIKGVKSKKIGPAEMAGDASDASRQLEHIGHLQELARSVIASCKAPPNVKNVKEFESDYLSLGDAFSMLMGSVYWPALKEHLGAGGDHIETMRTIMMKDGHPIMWTDGSLSKNHVKTAQDAWLILSSSGLRIIARSVDTKIWEYKRMNQRCKSCPVQEYEPVEEMEDDLR